MRYIPYPAYKDSGVEWLGEIPEGWAVKKAKYLVEEGDGGVKIGPFGSAIKLEMMTDSETGFVVYGQENVIERDFSIGKRFMPFSYEAQFSVYEVHSGDILVTMMGTGGRCCIVPKNCRKGIIDSHLMRIRLNPSFVCSDFFVRTFDESTTIRTQISLNSKGSIMQGLNKGIVNALVFPLPPLRTQQAIAAFLDAETARIDGLIKDYEELVVLLQEKRQALISHAVTRGLSELVAPDDPEFGEWAKPVTFKDSGVEWLGEIPEGWEPVACRRVINKIEQGWSPVAEDRNPDTDEWAVIKLSAVKFGKFQPTELKVIPSDQPVYPELQLKSGDVLMTRANTPQLVGDVCLVESCAERVIFSDLVYRIGLSDDLVTAKFFVAFFSSPLGRSQVENSARGTSQSMVKISHSAIKEFLIPLPSLDEQRAIANFLDKETAKMDTLVTEAESAIELLKEHRCALITNAVTGKINVEAGVPG